MSLPRALLLITFVTAIGMGLVSLGINRYSVSKIQASVGCSPQDLLSQDGDFDPTATVAIFNNELIRPQLAYIPLLTPSDTQVLGESSGDKWIEIDLSDQKLIAHQGDTIYLESPISSGLSGKTRKGDFNIWYKIVSTKMEGGSRANKTYYYLANVPYTMFFDKDIGIHGTYWHNNFGTPMSHGCVNTPTPIAERLFYWAGPHLPEGKKYVRSTPDNPGTRVVVHD